MATAELKPDTEAKAPKFFSELWQRWRKKRQRDRARNRSHVRFRVTREGIHFAGILIFIFIGAVIRDINLLILLAGSMIGLMLLQWRFNTSTLLGLQVERRLARATSVDQTSEVELHLTNPKIWLGAWLVLVEDPLSKVLPDRKRGGERGAALFDSVRPMGASTSRYQLTVHQRGKYRVGPSTISTRFPLGLGRGWRTLDNSCEIIVHPREGKLVGNADDLFYQDFFGHSKASSKAGVHEGEFYGLRPWETGDSRRWIHWRTTARLGELSVRQFEQRQQRQLCVILDLHTHRAGDNSLACEKCISFLATLAKSTVQQGRDKLSVGIAGKQPAVFPAVQSPVLVENLLDALAVADSATNCDLMELLRDLSIPLMNNPYLLVVSTRSDQSQDLVDGAAESSLNRVLSRLRIKWINVTADELEPYFQWT